MPSVAEQPKTEMPREAAHGLPPFGQLLPNALIVNALALGILLVIRQNWLALGVIAGAMVGIGVFWSLHLISRSLVDGFLEAEADRKQAQMFGPKPQAEVRRAALWRLVGMLALKYGAMAVGMAVLYHFAKSHLIPFFLAFIGAFAMTQLSIVSAAARAMRTHR